MFRSVGARQALYPASTTVHLQRLQVHQRLLNHILQQIPHLKEEATNPISAGMYRHTFNIEVRAKRTTNECLAAKINRHDFKSSVDLDISFPNRANRLVASSVGFRNKFKASLVLVAHVYGLTLLDATVRVVGKKRVQTIVSHCSLKYLSKKSSNLTLN